MQNCGVNRGAPAATRTRGLFARNEVLSPSELRARGWWVGPDSNGRESKLAFSHLEGGRHTDPEKLWSAEQNSNLRPPR